MVNINGDILRIIFQNPDPGQKMCQTCCHSLSMKYAQLLVEVTAFIIMAGCTAPETQNWRSDKVVWSLDKERVIKAAYNALVDPQTYIPAAGALIFQIEDWDRKTSDWASEHTPIFGSRSIAGKYSDYMLGALVGETVISGLYVPSENNSDDWIEDKAEGLCVEGAAIGATALTTGVLQNLTDRTRPNGDFGSFPSDHSSISFAAATLSNRNYDLIDMPDDLRSGLQIGNILLAGSASWARVESRKHFPSDILAGAALGHFLSAFIYDGFMKHPDDRKAEFLFLPYNHGIAVSYCISF